MHQHAAFEAIAEALFSSYSERGYDFFETVECVLQAYTRYCGKPQSQEDADRGFQTLYGQMQALMKPKSPGEELLILYPITDFFYGKPTPDTQEEAPALVATTAPAPAPQQAAAPQQVPEVRPQPEEPLEPAGSGEGVERGADLENGETSSPDEEAVEEDGDEDGDDSPHDDQDAEDSLDEEDPEEGGHPSDALDGDAEKVPTSGPSEDDVPFDAGSAEGVPLSGERWATGNEDDEAFADDVPRGQLVRSPRSAPPPVHEDEDDDHPDEEDGAPTVGVERTFESTADRNAFIDEVIYDVINQVFTQHHNGIIPHPDTSVPALDELTQPLMPVDHNVRKESGRQRAIRDATQRLVDQRRLRPFRVMRDGRRVKAWCPTWFQHPTTDDAGDDGEADTSSDEEAAVPSGVGAADPPPQAEEVVIAKDLPSLESLFD